MPYNSVRDLPKKVRDALPPKAQRMYMHVYNSAHGKYENPSRVAWGVVRRYYQQTRSGKWTKRQSLESTSSSDGYSESNTDTETDYD
ncbi:ORF-119 [Buzura suppressaria nucleopolyhedrovirus]|uniref:ORF-119 n=1 Tax=Buzura suppressaria nuclear polyhedrosis virus TaxID=74320 RepID=W5VKW4_NPVBS|nr:ORF-119 [Buzura suppressaria nucleopolyhedrovirus]AHH82708.1 ORF-119 [Buzura suppressaria nucleopolyhedrovirus]AKN91092.1 ORF-122 [Buzura suppressaria nucleopolyhedrovirus]QYF10655.1 hypothetical protein [Buzura suppressaria nucleopolyhedrovirus]